MESGRLTSTYQTMRFNAVDSFSASASALNWISRASGSEGGSIQLPRLFMVVVMPPTTRVAVETRPGARDEGAVGAVKVQYRPREKPKNLGRSCHRRAVMACTRAAFRYRACLTPLNQRVLFPPCRARN